MFISAAYAECLPIKLVFRILNLDNQCTVYTVHFDTQPKKNPLYSIITSGPIIFTRKYHLSCCTLLSLGQQKYMYLYVVKLCSKQKMDFYQPIFSSLGYAQHSAPRNITQLFVVASIRCLFGICYPNQFQNALSNTSRTQIIQKQFRFIPKKSHAWTSFTRQQ